MKKILTLMTLVLAGLYGGAQTLSPEVIASAGNYHSTGSFSLSWTVGEVAVSTLQNSSLILTQGFQQPWGLATGISNPQADWENEIWPNPVRELVNVKFSMEKAGEYILTLTDITGRKVLVLKPPLISPGESVSLDMKTCLPGIYLLHITSAEKKVSRVYKLIKR